MMIVRFDSQYSVIKPGRGFLLTVTAAPSGKTLLNAIKYIWIAWKCFLEKLIALKKNFKIIIFI